MFPLLRSFDSSTNAHAIIRNNYSKRVNHLMFGVVTTLFKYSTSWCFLLGLFVLRTHYEKYYNINRKR
jgi:hypothetical protein